MFTLTRPTIDDGSTHGIHENHVHAGWASFEQGDVGSVGPDFWMLLSDTPQHPFCQIAGRYNSGSIGLNQWNQNAHPVPTSSTASSGRNLAAATICSRRPITSCGWGRIKGIHQLIEAAALVRRHLSLVLWEHQTIPALLSPGPLANDRKSPLPFASQSIILSQVSIIDDLPTPLLQAYVPQMPSRRALHFRGGPRLLSGATRSLPLVPPVVSSGALFARS
jgi:hypothetical protein